MVYSDIILSPLSTFVKDADSITLYIHENKAEQNFSPFLSPSLTPIIDYLSKGSTRPKLELK